MPSPLQRVLRLRSMLEALSRSELERRAAVEAGVEQVRRREGKKVYEGRSQAQLAILEEEESVKQMQRRVTEWAGVAIAAKSERQLRSLVEAAARSAEAARKDYFERRKERKQVESVLDAERVRLKTEQERRMQREMDDWFGRKQTRERSAAKQQLRNPEKALSQPPEIPQNSGNRPA